LRFRRWLRRFHPEEAANTAQLPIGVIRLNRTDHVTATSSFTNSLMTLVGACSRSPS
jgi:hypothetical protein